MAELVWDAQGGRLYERGVSRGVLYVATAVPWGGITSIEEQYEGLDSEALQHDGITYFNLISTSSFKATLSAFSSPKEFDRCDGILELAPGLYADQQRRSTFGLSYRTEIGSDTVVNRGYKIHLVYGCSAIPSTRTHETESNSPSPSDLSWEISTVPPETSVGMRPTAHLVVNSMYTDPDAMANLEKALYGSSSTNPYLPSIANVVNILAA